MTREAETDPNVKCSLLTFCTKFHNKPVFLKEIARHYCQALLTTHPKVEWGRLTLHLSSARLPELHIAVRADD